MSADLFENPFYNGLITLNAGLAVGSAPALRYPADVIPFGGVANMQDPAQIAAFGDLLAGDEKVYLTGTEPAKVDGLKEVVTLPCVQMHFTGDSSIAVLSDAVVPVPPAEAAEMVALTDVAFPGYFRAKTYLLGDYFGIRIEGQLVAMAGVRVSLPGWREISAVCTHPDHRGKGYAETLIRHVMAKHYEAGAQSYLHAAAANTRAIAIYERLGFTHTRYITVHGMQLA